MTTRLPMKMNSRRNWMGSRHGIEWKGSGGWMGAIQGLVK